MSCECGSIGRTDLRQCPEHFHLWLGDKRLASIGSIIRQVWPPPASPPPPEVLENARDRGSEVDKLFADYVRGTLTAIPAGTRQDARALFLKLQKWYDAQNFRKAEVQVLLGDTDHGGVLDFAFDGIPVDLKCTYNVEQTAIMQVAGYSKLYGAEGMILHVTERFPTPKLVKLGRADFDDWETMLAHWRMLTRRLK